MDQLASFQYALNRVFPDDPFAMVEAIFHKLHFLDVIVGRQIAGSLTMKPALPTNTMQTNEQIDLWNNSTSIMEEFIHVTWEVTQNSSVVTAAIHLIDGDIRTHMRADKKMSHILS